jgi:hypothetical protein
VLNLEQGVLAMGSKLYLNCLWKLNILNIFLEAATEETVSCGLWAGVRIAVCILPCFGVEWRCSHSKAPPIALIYSSTESFVGMDNDAVMKVPI